MVASLLFATAGVVHALLRLAYGVFLARIVLSWVNPSPPPGIVRSVIQAIYDVTDPVLDGARKLLPFLRAGMFDLSPIAVFLAIGFLDSFLYGSLTSLARSMA
jgi:YggT family protein